MLSSYPKRPHTLSSASGETGQSSVHGVMRGEMRGRRYGVEHFSDSSGDSSVVPDPAESGGLLGLLASLNQTVETVMLATLNQIDENVRFASLNHTMY